MAESTILLTEIRAMRSDFNAKIETSQKEIQGTMEKLTNELSTKIDKMETDMNEFKSRLERFEKTVEELQKKEATSTRDPWAAAAAAHKSKRPRAESFDNNDRAQEESNLKSMIKLSGPKNNLSREDRKQAAVEAIKFVNSIIPFKEIRTYGRYGTESVVVFENPINADSFYKEATKQGQDHPTFRGDTLYWNKYKTGWKYEKHKATSKLARAFHEIYTKVDSMDGAGPKIESDKNKGEIYFNTETVAKVFVNEEFDEPRITFDKVRCEQLEVDVEAIRGKFKSLVAQAKARYG